MSMSDPDRRHADPHSQRADGRQDRRVAMPSSKLKVAIAAGPEGRGLHRRLRMSRLKPASPSWKSP